MSVTFIFIILLLLWQIQFSDVSAVISIITSVVFMASVVTGAAYVVWKGKSIAELREDNERLSKRNKDLKEELEESKLKTAAVMTEVSEFKRQLQSKEGELLRMQALGIDFTKDVLRLEGRIKELTGGGGQ